MLDWLIGKGANAGFGALAKWVGSGAAWILHALGAVLAATTSPPVTSNWFGADYRSMSVLAAVVILPLACVGAVQAIVRQSAGILGRTFFLNVPVALVFTGIAVQLVHLGLLATDEMSAALAGSIGVHMGSVLAPLTLAFSAGQGPGAPGFVLFLFSLVAAVAGVILWMELVLRSAAISVATFFFPLALATLAWPAISSWCRRLAETIAVLILSKFVIVAVLVLGSSALAGSLHHGGGGVASLVTGLALLLLAVFAPYSLFKLIPFVEGSAAVHLEGSRQRAQAGASSAVERGQWVQRQVKETRIGFGDGRGVAGGTAARGGASASAGAGGIDVASATQGVSAGAGLGMAAAGGEGAAGAGASAGAAAGASAGPAGAAVVATAAVMSIPMEATRQMAAVFTEAAQAGIGSEELYDTVAMVRHEGVAFEDQPGVVQSRLQDRLGNAESLPALQETRSS